LGHQLAHFEIQISVLVRKVIDSASHSIILVKQTKILILDKLVISLDRCGISIAGIDFELQLVFFLSLLLNLLPQIVQISLIHILQSP